MPETTGRQLLTKELEEGRVCVGIRFNPPPGMIVLHALEGGKCSLPLMSIGHCRDQRCVCTHIWLDTRLLTEVQQRLSDWHAPS